MKKSIYVFIATILLSTIFSQNVNALSCVEPNISKWMNDFDGAIVATVTDIKDGMNNKEQVRIVNAIVNESYKGVNSETITILEHIIWAPSNVNNTYIYFLVKVDNQWVSSACTTISTAEGNETNKALYDELKQYPKLTLSTNNVELETNEGIEHKQQTEASLSSNHIISPIVWLSGIIGICCLLGIILLVRKIRR